ncbi:hypothetical protein INR49_030896 [Caranx melampygus]|nr:hypothetical protein INR49_030896 [Caranx melampygus]
MQAINAHISTATFATSIDTPGPQNSTRLATFTPCLQGYTSARLPVKHPEEAVVRPCHDHTEERRGEERRGEETLQVVKVWFMALERTVDIVLSRVPRLSWLVRLPFRL